MTLRKLSALGAKVREKRGDRKLRDVAEEIGISAPTLMRIEAGRMPDIQTFGKVCQWLQISPDSFLGYSQVSVENPSSPTQVAVHMKGQRMMSEKTLAALSRMIFLASSSQHSSVSIDDENS